MRRRRHGAVVDLELRSGRDAAVTGDCLKARQVTLEMRDEANAVKPGLSAEELAGLRVV